MLQRNQEKKRQAEAKEKKLQEEAERAAKEAAALKLKQESELQVSCHGVGGYQNFSTAGICPLAHVALRPQTLSSWLGDMGG